MKTIRTLFAFAVGVAALGGFADGAVTKTMDLPYVRGQGTVSGNDNWGTYVPTTCVLTSNSVVALEVELTTTQKDCTIFANVTGDYGYSLTHSASAGWSYRCGKKSVSNKVMGEVGKKYKITCAPDGLWVDDVLVKAQTPASFTLTRMCIFSTCNYDASKETYSYSNWNRGKAILYSFKVSEPDDKGELQVAFELKPCLGSDGKVGLYNTATAEIYAAEGSANPLASTFTARAADGAAGLKMALEMVKKAASNGGTSIGSGAHNFNLEIEPGVYDVSELAMVSGSHLDMSVAKSGRIIGKGATRADTVFVGGGEAKGLRVISLGSMTLTNVTVTGGYLSSASNGGGITTGSSGNGAVLDCVVSNNYAKGSNGNGGGGIWGVGTVRGCLIANNSSSHGGGLRSCSQVVDCVIANNYASDAGGGTSGCNLTQCEVIDNATGHNGGGSSGGVHNGCWFVRNECTKAGDYGTGGGVDACTVCSNCVFVANTDHASNSSYGSAAAGSALVGCVISNSVAKRLLFSATSMRRCRVVDCGASANDSTWSFSVCGNKDTTTTQDVVNCVFENIALSNANDRVAQYRRLVNCTIRNVTGAAHGVLATTSVAVNTIVADCSPYDISASYCGTLTNCLYKTAAGTFADGQLVDCRPVANVRWSRSAPTYDIRASSAAFNRALEDDWILSLVGDTDCAGRPRRMFGCLDIGAMECQDDTIPGGVLMLR